MMNEDTEKVTAADQAIFELLWPTRRSIRYHHYREAFYDSWRMRTAALNLLLSTGSIATFMAEIPYAPLIGGVLIAVFSTFDLVVGYASKARLHNNLARRWVELEKQIVAAGTGAAKMADQFKAARLDVEADEPPIKRVLDVFCHNELARATYSDSEVDSNIKLIKWYQFPLRNYLLRYSPPKTAATAQ